MLKTRKELIEDSVSGRAYVRYTPYLEVTGPCASGQLSFACWEAYVGDGEAIHRETIANALANARRVIAEIAADLAS